MDATDQNSLDFSYEYLDNNAYGCVYMLVDRIKAELESINEHIPADSDSPLKNCWDEICAHCQGDEFLIWEPYEMTINGLIGACFEELNRQDQLCVNFAALQASNNIREPEFDCVYMDEVNTFLYKEVLRLALNDTNPRVQAYLDPYSAENEDSQHNPDEYVLLRVDPVRRVAFLAMLDLLDCVKPIELDEQTLPVFYDLLNNLDVEST